MTKKSEFEGRVELGCTGHLIVGNSCRWSRNTVVGDYCISSVGDYYIGEATERTEVGCNRYFETMVFELLPEEASGSEGCGCRAVKEWCEIDMDGYQTAGEAQVGHEAMVAKYSAAPDLLRQRDELKATLELILDTADRFVSKRDAVSYIGGYALKALQALAAAEGK